jgi:hypothetical protein
MERKQYQFWWNCIQKRKEDSFLCMKDIRSINVELAANQDMFFPFLCMRGRHVTWENTFSTPNSGEHSTHHLTAAAKAAGQQHPLTPFSANPS